MSVSIQEHLKKPGWNLALALRKEHMSLLYCKVTMQGEKEYLAGDSKISSKNYLCGERRRGKGSLQEKQLRDFILEVVVLVLGTRDIQCPAEATK